MQVKKILLSLLLIPSALAASPADIFESIFGSFSGLSNLNIDYVVTLTIFMYFILFLVLFLEGVRFLPFFGQRGEVSRSGKAFAAAASALSTIAIFFVDNGKTLQEIIPGLLAPFGVWGAVALAGIIAWIAYYTIRRAEIFEDHILVAMGLCVGIGVTLAGFFLTLDSIMGWGFLIILLAMLIGFIVWIIGLFTGYSGGPGGGGNGGGNGGTGNNPPGGGGSSGDGNPPNNGNNPPNGGGPPGGGGGPPGGNNSNGTVDYSPPPPSSRPPRPPPDPPFNPGDFVPGRQPDGQSPPPRPNYTPKKPQPVEGRRIFVDLAPWFLLPRSQGGLGCCVAFSGSSILEYIINRSVGRHTQYLSPLFMHYHITSRPITVQTGSILSRAAQFMIDQGICKEHLWTFEDHTSTKYQQQPPPPTYSDAMSQRVIQQEVLPHNNPNQWIRALIDEHPIHIGFNVTRNFKENPGGSTYNLAYYNRAPDSGGEGSHAMVVVGYDSHYQDDQGNVFEAFKIRNSWGLSWGDQGYTWMSRDLLTRLMRIEAWDPPIVYTGWQSSTSTNQKLATITGRAVFDDRTQPILSDLSGREIFLDGTAHAPDHAFIVGVLAQVEIEGKETLFIIAEKEVKNPHGHFQIDFHADWGSFRPLTLLSTEYPKQFSHINFKKLPAGVVLYKRGMDDHDPERYFHIVDFKYSEAGRGGESATHLDNPRSDRLHPGIEFSGRPIIFSDDEHREQYVIIPIVPYLEHEEAEDDHLHSLLAEIGGWGGTETEFLQKLITDLGNNDLSKAKQHQKQVGRSQKKLSRFEAKLQAYAQEVWPKLPSEQQEEVKQKLLEIHQFIKKILVATSRSEGKIHHLLEKLRLLKTQLEHEPTNPKWKEDYDLTMGPLLKQVKETKSWVEGLLALTSKKRKKGLMAKLKGVFIR